MKAEIVETTFHSRFRFRFLKYPLFKKVVSFRFSVIRKYPLLKKSRFFSGTRNKKVISFRFREKDPKRSLFFYAQIK